MLSAEEITFCCHRCGFGCNGGYPIKAWEYYQRKGLVTGGGYDSGEVSYARLANTLKNKNYNLIITIGNAFIRTSYSAGCFLYFFRVISTVNFKCLKPTGLSTAVSIFFFQFKSQFFLTNSGSARFSKKCRRLNHRIRLVTLLNTALQIQ